MKKKIFAALCLMMISLMPVMTEWNTTGKSSSVSILAEGQWKCRRCGHYNWAQNSPYTCNNCGCSIGEC